MTKTEHDSYLAGKRAYHQGKKPHENPHSLRSDEAEHYNWIDGWNDAADESNT